MNYRSLGRTGIKVSDLCLGCMMFGERTSPEDSWAIIDRALDAGINFLDTADVYSRGRSEEVTGEALRRNGKRDRVVLATKAHGRMDDTDPNAAGNSRRHLIAACEASLRRLKTDWIDLYQIHRPSPDVPIDETLRALDDLVRSGKVRYIGTSTFAAWQVVESLWASDRLGLNRFVTEQPPYNLLDRRIERELIPMAQTYGIGIIPWSPLAGGLLTGKYNRDTPPPGDSRFGMQKGAPHLQGRYHEGVFAVLEKLTPIASAKGCTLSQLALAWCRTRPGITSPIIGPRTLDQLEDNLPAAEIDFSAEELAAIDAACPPGRMISPFYEAAFGPHPFRI
jgi:aryl-alcohol dehydrogenase-like predicted oxidoreductase